MTEFTVLIPARLSSTRLPQKALADIHGKPMVVRTAEAALKSNAARVVIATDDERILNVCALHHIDAVLTDNTHQSGTDRLAQAAQLLHLSDNALVVNVQGDEPMIDPHLINRLADFLASGDAPMATAAYPINHIDHFFNPNIVKVVLDQKQNALYFSRAPIPYPRKNEQTCPNLALHHIGIYAYRVPFLRLYQQLPQADLEKIESLEQLRVLFSGQKIAVLCCESAPAPGVDTQEDLERVRELFQARL